jgi:hypothetical protein
MPRGGVGTVDEEGLKPHDAQVKGYGGQSAEPAGQDGHGQQALPLAGHPAQQPGVEMCVKPWRPAQ